jgi:hypothetical protein
VGGGQASNALTGRDFTAGKNKKLWQGSNETCGG